MFNRRTRRALSQLFARYRQLGYVKIESCNEQMEPSVEKTCPHFTLASLWRKTLFRAGVVSRTNGVRRDLPNNLLKPLTDIEVILGRFTPQDTSLARKCQRLAIGLAAFTMTCYGAAQTQTKTQTFPSTPDCSLQRLDLIQIEPQARMAKYSCASSMLQQDTKQQKPEAKQESTRPESPTELQIERLL